MKKNEGLFHSLKECIQNNDQDGSLKLIQELDGTDLTSEDKTHLAEAKQALTKNDFAQALECIKYLW